MPLNYLVSILFTIYSVNLQDYIPRLYLSHFNYCTLKQLVISTQTRIPFIIKVLSWIAPAFTLFMGISLRTMLERFVTIANVIEKVDLFLFGKQSCTNTMNRGISPTLKWTLERSRDSKKNAYLVVETTLFIQKVEKLGVCFTSPKV